MGYFRLLNLIFSVVVFPLSKQLGHTVVNNHCLLLFFYHSCFLFIIAVISCYYRIFSTEKLVCSGKLNISLDTSDANQTQQKQIKRKAMESPLERLFL